MVQALVGTLSNPWSSEISGTYVKELNPDLLAHMWDKWRKCSRIVLISADLGIACPLIKHQIEQWAKTWSIYEFDSRTGEGLGYGKMGEVLNDIAP